MSTLSLVLWTIPAFSLSAALVLILGESLRTVSDEVREAAGEALCARLAGEAVGSEANDVAATLQPHEACGEETAVESSVNVVSENASPPGEAQAPDALWQEDLARICREFRIRELSLLVAKERPGARRRRAPRVLVEFAPGAPVDSRVFFRLREALHALLEHPVELVRKRSDNLGPREDRAVLAHTLYAA